MGRGWIARGYDEPLRVWEEEEGGWWLPIRGGRGETRGEWKVLTPPYKSSGGGGLLARPEPRRCSSGLLFNRPLSPLPTASPEFRSPYVSFASRCTRTAARRKASQKFQQFPPPPLSSSPVILQFPSICLHLDIITLPDVNLCRAPGMATRFFPKKISREKNRGVLRSCGGIEGGGGGRGGFFFENFGEWRSVFLVSNMGFFSKNLANYFFPMGISGDRYFWFRM